MNTKWLKEQLELRGMSQADLARALGRDPSAISRLFKGERGISVEEVRKLAILFGIPVGQVMNDGDTISDQVRFNREMDTATARIEKAYGKGSIARFGGGPARNIDEELEEGLPSINQGSTLEQRRFSTHIPLYGRANYRTSYIARENGPIRVVPRPAELMGVDGAYAADVISDEMVPRYFPGERIYVAPSLVRTENAFVVVWHNVGPGELGRILRLREFDDSNVYLYAMYPIPVDVILAHGEIKAIHHIVGAFSA